MENRILKLCLDILERGNEMVDCNAIRCNCCPFDSKGCCLARIEHSVKRRAIAENYIKKHTSEERHSTGKTFREVIADIKKGEVWESEEKIISLMNTNDVVITLKDRDRRINLMGFASSTLYHLQRKEYTFEEAFKAYEEGKEIESCYSGVKYLIQHGGSDCYSDGRKTNLIEFNEIRGKWYINN